MIFWIKKKWNSLENYLLFKKNRKNLCKHLVFIKMLDLLMIIVTLGILLFFKYARYFSVDEDARYNNVYNTLDKLTVFRSQTIWEAHIALHSVPCHPYTVLNPHISSSFLTHSSLSNPHRAVTAHVAWEAQCDRTRHTFEGVYFIFLFCAFILNNTI